MDRQTAYSGQVPRTLDILKSQQNAMVALAKLSAGCLGTTTVVNGLTCTPTTPATLDVVLTPGEIYQVEDLEQTIWSALPQDLTHTILKQGILLDPVTMAVTPPTTFGYSQVYLLEVAYQDNDSGSTVLPYFNAASPSVPFSGPGNAGTAQNTVRQGQVAFQLKAGTQAPTGTQLTPNADPGWVGLFAITVAQGQVTITAGNIVTLVSAPPPLPTQEPPFIPVTLPQVPVADQSGMWVYATDTSTTVNVMTAKSFNPPISTLIPGMGLRVKVGSWATVNFTGNISSGTNTILNASSTAGLVIGQLLYGTGIPANTTISNISGSTITMSVNATATATGEAISAQGNTGAVTLDVGTGANAVVRASGAALSPGDIFSANQIIQVVWDGSRWQLVNFLGAQSSSVTNNFSSSTGIPYTADTSATPNSVIAPFNPAITSTSAGMVVIVKLANTVTGPATITVNALAAVPIVNEFLQPLAANDAVAGEMMILVYTGTSWTLIGAVGPAPATGGLVGQFEDVVGSAPGGTKTASWSVAGVIAGTALNGLQYRGTNLSLSFNGANVGVNGMDTGPIPTAGDLSVYAIYNPTTQVWACLGCSGGVSGGRVYSGTNMPTGYTASALIFTGKTDGSGNVVAFHQFDNEVSINLVCYSLPLGAGSINGTYNAWTTINLAAFSVASSMPLNAKKFMGYNTYDMPAATAVASTANGQGMIINNPDWGTDGSDESSAANSTYDVPMSLNDMIFVTAQTLYIATNSQASGNENWIMATGYKF